MVLGILAGIAALIAAGCIIAYAVILTIQWLKKKILDYIKKKNAKKVAVGDIESLVNTCENQVSLDDFLDLQNEGYTNFTAAVDANGKVTDVEIIKDTNNDYDEEVDKLINRTGEGMVVINA